VWPRRRRRSPTSRSTTSSMGTDTYVDTSGFYAWLVARDDRVHYPIVPAESSENPCLIEMYFRKTRSKVPLYMAHRKRSMLFPFSVTHHAPERFKRAWLIDLFADSMPPLPMGRPSSLQSS